MDEDELIGRNIQYSEGTFFHARNRFPAMHPRFPGLTFPFFLCFFLLDGIDIPPSIPQDRYRPPTPAGPLM